MRYEDIRVGQLVICNKENRYYLTNTSTLCVITNIYSFHPYKTMRVVLVSAKQSTWDFGNKNDRLGINSYDVECDNFDYITLEEYLDKFPDSITNYDTLQKYCPDYSKEIKKEVKEVKKEEPFTLTSEQRKDLLEEMMKLLQDYNYPVTEYGCNRIIDEWIKNKGNLIKLMQKHPNYNGKYQIHFYSDFERICNFNEIINFFNYLENLNSNILERVKKYGFEFKEVVNYIKNLQLIINKMSNAQDGIIRYIGKTQIVINENPIEYYTKEKNRFMRIKEKYLDDKTLYISTNNAYTKESYDKFVNCNQVIRLFRNYYDNILTEEITKNLNDIMPELRAHPGQKTSRVVNKFCKLAGFDKDEDYNRNFATYSDAINPLKIKRHTVLSCHPIDYFTMSFGNSWASCHTIDKCNIRGCENSYHGEYSGGTLSYMLDPTSMVFYTVDKDYNGDKLELQPKINRNMFHIGEKKIVQGRVYPQTTDGAKRFYTEIRNIVQKVIADCMGVNNLWTLKTGTYYCNKVICTYGVHYPDYKHFDDCNVSYLKHDDGSLNENLIIVGHELICPNCGDTHTYESCILCSDCIDKYKEMNDDCDDF